MVFKFAGLWKSLFLSFLFPASLPEGGFGHFASFSKGLLSLVAFTVCLVYPADSTLLTFDFSPLGVGGFLAEVLRFRESSTLKISADGILLESKTSLSKQSSTSSLLKSWGNLFCGSTMWSSHGVNWKPSESNVVLCSLTDFTLMWTSIILPEFTDKGLIGCSTATSAFESYVYPKLHLSLPFKRDIFRDDTFRESVLMTSLSPSSSPLPLRRFCFPWAVLVWQSVVFIPPYVSVARVSPPLWQPSDCWVCCAQWPSSLSLSSSGCLFTIWST